MASGSHGLLNARACFCSGSLNANFRDGAVTVVSWFNGRSVRSCVEGIATGIDPKLGVEGYVDWS